MQFKENPIDGCSILVYDFVREFFLVHHSPVDHWFGLRTPLSALTLANVMTMVGLALLFKV